MTSQEKTFEAIAKLQEIELELHRLRNALDRANKALDAQRTWAGLTDDEVKNFVQAVWPREATPTDYIRAIEAKLKEKNVQR
jgi:hypothetical protein